MMGFLLVSLRLTLGMMGSETSRLLYKAIWRYSEKHSSACLNWFWRERCWETRASNEFCITNLSNNRRGRFKLKHYSFGGIEESIGDQVSMFSSCLKPF